MSARNDITRDRIRTTYNTKEFKSNYEKIFGGSDSEEGREKGSADELLANKLAKRMGNWVNDEENDRSTTNLKEVLEELPQERQDKIEERAEEIREEVKGGDDEVEG